LERGGSSEAAFVDDVYPAACRAARRKFTCGRFRERCLSI
jgi:hypothetical protein